jgi:hypothetical protein
LTRLFGFIQLDLPGRLPVADGRYVIRDGETERVLVVQTLGAPPPARRRRRRAREAEPDTAPSALPLTRAAVVRAFEPFDSERTASAWLETSTASEEKLDALIAEALDLLNRALHAQAVASGDPQLPAISAHHAAAARLGYGSGEQVAAGDFAEAREIGPQSGNSRKRQRDDELRPQERLAALLGGREQPDPCEALLLRARADLDAGRNREAALQLRVGLEALLAQLTNPPADSGHDEDMAALKARRAEAGEIANAALLDELDTEQLTATRELVALCERVLRRRRVLRG